MLAHSSLHTTHIRTYIRTHTHNTHTQTHTDTHTHTYASKPKIKNQTTQTFLYKITNQLHQQNETKNFYSKT